MVKIMKDNRYDFLKGTKAKFLLALCTGTVYNLLYVITAFFMKEMVDAGNKGDMNLIKKIMYYAILYLIFYICLGVVRCIALKRYKQTVMRNYKKMYVDNILAMKYTDFKKNDNGKYLSNLTNNAQVISEGYVEGRINLVRAFSRAILIIIVMIAMNWKLFLITLATFLLPLLSGTVVNGKIVKTTSYVSKKNAQLVTSIKDLLAGFGVIKSFKAEKEVSKSFSKSFDDIEGANATLRALDVITYVFSDFSILLVMIIVFLVGSIFVSKQIMTIGGIMAFVELLVDLQGPIEVLPGFIAKYNASKTILAEDYIKIKTDDIPQNEISVIENGIKINNLKFGYSEEQNVLNGINMNIEKGKMYAVVGASGSGKSTLANLICGNYTNYDGEILIDDKELRTVGNIYDVLTVIDQNVFIFNDSIYDNISMYKKFSDEDMSRAVKLSGMEELIKAKGGDYQCGENGTNLSGGEKQRVSIARALLLKKQIIIMDESTSSLDIVTARDIENTVYNLNDSIRLVITHNLNDIFLKKCDGIFVIKNGEIVEFGQFDELIQRKQIFSNMYELWK